MNGNYIKGNGFDKAALREVDASFLNSFNSDVALDEQLQYATTSRAKFAVSGSDNTTHFNTNLKKKGLKSLPSSKPYECGYCGWPCSNSSNLKAHTRTHTGEKPFVCHICNAGFIQHSNLKSHLRTHTGEKPYACEFCGMRFSRSSHLTGHKRTHTGEKPYVCGACGERFATSTHLQTHKKRHAPVIPNSCPICELSFSDNTDLVLHVKSHKDDRPYKCCDCAAAFKSKPDLRSHRKVHVDDRPFICGRCVKTFKTYHYLCKHLKTCTHSIPDYDDSSEESAAIQNQLLDDIKVEPEEVQTFELVDEHGNRYMFQEDQNADQIPPQDPSSIEVSNSTDLATGNDVANIMIHSSAQPSSPHTSHFEINFSADA